MCPSSAYRIAFGPRAGQKVLTLWGAMPRDASARQALRADIDGFSLHAAVRVQAHDRKRLEQLCRYITRPALSDERVQVNAAGQGELKLKTPKRVFDIDMHTCPNRGAGALKISAAILERPVIQKVLEHLGLDPQPPPPPLPPQPAPASHDGSRPRARVVLRVVMAGRR